MTQAPNARPNRVVIVDDHVLAREVLQNMLHAMG